MKTIEWGPHLETGIEKIDFQHHKLIAMVKELSESINEPNSQVRNALVRIFLEQLLDYTSYHFKFEEELMEKAGYKDLAAHKKNHEALRKKAADLQARFLNEENVIPILLQVLNSWLIDHIQGEDKKYAPDLKKLGPIY